MVSQADIGPVSTQYAAAATVPLIKSPSLWLPKPIEMPSDIHPLPEDITAYFVYPFTLEEHILSLRPSPADAISQRRARNAEILHQREVEEEQREKDALRKIAPGYNPASLLVPTSTSSSSAPHPHPHSQSQLGTLPQGEQSDLAALSSLDGIVPTTGGGSASGPGSGDAMDDLVARLEEMESRR